MVLGDTPQAKADGREIVAKRLQVAPRGAFRRPHGARGFPEWIGDGDNFVIRRTIASAGTEVARAQHRKRTNKSRRP